MYSKIIISFLLINLSFGCVSMEDIDACKEGHDTVRNGKFETASKLLTKCLTSQDLSSYDKAEAFKSRAWAHYNLHKNAMAVKDQEAAFELVKPSKYNELVNYASYLRRVKRYKDSLSPLNAAVKLDNAAGQINMVTQYNLGWSLYELGKYKEAVTAFTKGIPGQPDFAFVYWKRGLAYHALGMKPEAKADFISYKKYLERKNMEVPPEWKDEITEVLAKYNL